MTGRNSCPTQTATSLMPGNQAVPGSAWGSGSSLHSLTPHLAILVELLLPGRHWYLALRIQQRERDSGLRGKVHIAITTTFWGSHYVQGTVPRALMISFYSANILRRQVANYHKHQAPPLGKSGNPLSKGLGFSPEPGGQAGSSFARGREELPRPVEQQVRRPGYLGGSHIARTPSHTVQ